MSSPPPAKRLPMPSVQYTQLFINGRFVDSRLGRTFPSFNPFTGQQVATVQEAGQEDVDAAVKAARAAFEVWRAMDASQRGRILYKLGDLVEQNLETIAGLDSLENGIPINESLHTVGAAAAILRFYGGLADKIKGETIPSDGNFLTITLKEPMGIAAIIIPWNSPTLMAAKTVGPALAAGNAVLLKPAEQTSLSALFIAHLSTLLPELPPGVLNVLPGDGRTGAMLSAHASIDKITFTGSTEVGQSILAASARSNLKRVTLELGGKSPLVVFEDADVEQAARLAFAALFVSNGQVCCCGSRTYVHASIYEQFVEETRKLALARVVGDPFST
ncbi:PREDICTED: aldehyde dehydrogenase family 2 member B4, mitochondrial-like, partial [Rhagoletis zephyria]|uniref:aldehyde dehydrogenase family 2 member B4, mitochondrial-like n=1 Tax=Rhagoletis zephyria TaxID=28612 RepID=UPI00081152CD